MHFDIRVHEPRYSTAVEIGFPQTPVFPLNRARQAPAIVQALPSNLAAHYSHAQTGEHAAMTGNIRGYRLRSDLNNENYPWIDIHPEEFAVIVDHLQSRAQQGSPNAAKALEIQTKTPPPAKPRRKKPKRPRPKKPRRPGKQPKRHSAPETHRKKPGGKPGTKSTAK